MLVLVLAAAAAAAAAIAFGAGKWLLTKAVNASTAAAGGQRPAKGLKWPRGIDSDGQHLGVFFPNFCCGTAGIAYFLARLHQVEDPAADLHGQYLAAALGGAVYLQSVANKSDHGLMVRSFTFIHHISPINQAMQVCYAWGVF